MSQLLVTWINSWKKIWKELELQFLHVKSHDYRTIFKKKPHHFEVFMWFQTPCYFCLSIFQWCRMIYHLKSVYFIPNELGGWDWSYFEPNYIQKALKWDQSRISGSFGLRRTNFWRWIILQSASLEKRQ